MSELDGVMPTETTEEPKTTESQQSNSYDYKKEIDKERKLRGDTERALKQLQEQVKGIDPAKYKELEALQVQAEQRNQHEAEMRLNWETEWTAKVQVEQKGKHEAESKFQNLQKSTLAEKAYQSAKGRSGGEGGLTHFDVVMGVVGDRFRLNDKNHLEVVDENGTRLFSAKDSTKLMSVTEFFETLHKHPILSPHFSANEAAKGSGMRRDSGYAERSPDSVSTTGSRADRLTRLREEE